MRENKECGARGTNGANGGYDLDRILKRSLALAASALFCLPGIAAINAQQSPASELSKAGVDFFELKIRPALANHCYRCHSEQAKTPAGGLRLDTRAGMLKGGASGEPAVFPGDPEKSLLIRAIRYVDPKLQMPMGGRLPDAVISDFEAWIRMGAPDPRDGGNETASSPRAEPYDFDEAGKFWSFQPLKQATVPSVKNQAWVRSPIDNFILAKLEEKSLAPASDADKLTLIRRATFDLTGMPPTLREVDVFLNDNSPNAFEKVIDRLLAGAGYGEKWGRHWLDLVRYADTAGCNSDFPVPSGYKYRNYVIEAFNRDKPYDQFIREQIAGDLLPAASQAERNEKIIATGYIAVSRRFGSRDVDDNLMIDDTIDNLGKAFLGLSINCARCHDHKFDPIPQKDYYALYGVFKSTRYAFPGTEIYRRPHSLIPLAAGKEAEQLEKYQTEVRDLQLKVEALHVERGFVRGRQRERETSAEILAEKAGKTVQTDQLGRIIAEGKLIEEDHDDRNRYAGEASTRTVEEIEAELNKVRLRLSELNDPPNVERAYAVTEGKPADARIHRKGDLKNLGDVAPRGFLRILGGARLPANHKGSGRLELAGWIADAKNPLTARVIVNRIWLHHFGKGLVPTPNDFGVRGLAPTHPELLDYLSTQFIADGWSFKKMHRRLMLSHVYQISASGNAANAMIDAGNAYLWRFNRRRLHAEEIRDAMLSVSGALDRTINGAHPFPPERDWKYSQHNPFVAVYEHNGRGVYLMQQRIRAHPQLSIFDGADSNTAVGARASSTTPLQALFMMNNPFVHKQADLFAVRVGMAYADAPKRIEYAYRLAFGRKPSAAELSRGLAYLSEVCADLAGIGAPEEEQTRPALASYLRVLLSSSEFIYVD
ncbi:MAG: PSD1 domain-containing protein [Blastocatellales bacterium]|nr:PSD1 domain-containing protein [Blastocatellales bacterium]